VERREPDCPLTGAWEAARWPGDGGGRNSSAERARAQRVRNGGRDECDEKGQAPRPFIGSEGERGGRASEGNGRRRWCAIME
jgi:hypothetical protein